MAICIDHPAGRCHQAWLIVGFSLSAAVLLRTLEFADSAQSGRQDSAEIAGERAGPRIGAPFCRPPD